MREVVIVSGARTPIGSLQGALSSIKSTDLGGIAIKAALERAGVAPNEVDEVLMGCVLPAGLGQAPARQAAFSAGLAKETPCTTVNKVCGSGLKTVMMATQAILAGDVDIAVAGGMESMSNVPYYVPGARTGLRFGNAALVDGMQFDGLWDIYNNYAMGNAAELCARELHIGREEQDAYAAESYRRAAAAHKAGAFKLEVTPVEVTIKKEKRQIVDDEEPSRGGDLAKLKTLRPAFDKDGTVTAGNSSSINDGGAALVLMSRETAEKRGAKILGRVVAQAMAAQAPEWFTTAPAAAIDRALGKAGWKRGEVDLFEINEAFAVVALANNKLLGLDAARVNVNGGAVALGHPIGCSGSRILVTLLHALAARNLKRGVASLCLGGGEAVALCVERV
ncbi:MAG: acetyl-CoA C-acyltransferase [Polyangia bacterium]